MRLIDALTLQREFCINRENYHCGIFYNSFEQEDLLREYMIHVFATCDDVYRIYNNRGDFKVRFYNGSAVNLIKPSDNCRGRKLQGAIYDSTIPREIVHSIIYSTAIPIISRHGFIYRDDNPLERFFKVDLNKELELL